LLSYTLEDPTITGVSASITYPPLYEELAQYTLGLINQDRLSLGDQAVNLSLVPSGQQHADSMLFFGYLSHWDTQGLKPYMRYSLLNGTGAVFENVAWQTQSPFAYSSLDDLKSALVKMNLQMMYDDSAFNWEHRSNILDPDHTSVSLGIAYDEDNVYLVEDFENIFVNLTSPLTLSDGLLRIEGTTSLALDLSVAAVYMDATPTNISVNALRQDPQYTGSYGLGTEIGVVLPPSGYGITGPPGTLSVNALTWQTGPGLVNLSLPLEPFIASFGKGVYTVYLLGSDGEAILSYSFFV
jgi:uncharacterized protein YkwD